MRWAELSRHVKFLVVLRLSAMHDHIVVGVTSGHVAYISLATVVTPTYSPKAPVQRLLLQRYASLVDALESCLSVLHLVRAVHLLKLDLCLLVKLRMVNQVALDGLDDAFGFTVDEDFLHAEEGLFYAGRVIDVDIVVQVLDKHVSHLGVPVRRSIYQEHTWLDQHNRIWLFPTHRE